jgi:DNA repair exonuclease SbcCD ATPase subunit
MGYELKFLGKSGKPLKYPGLKPPGAKGFFRFHKLGADYTLEAIDYRILSKYVKLDPFSKEDRKLVAQNRAQNQPPYQKRVTGLRGLYLRYCYELHIIEKYPTSVKRVSFFLREDVAKLDKLDQQTRFLAENDIETIDQIMERRSSAISRIAQLTEERKSLNNDIQRLSRHGDTAAAQEIKVRRNMISAELKELRKEVSLCDAIALRSAQTREELEKLLDEQELSERRNKADELLRRRSGTGRTDEFGGR